MWEFHGAKGGVSDVCFHQAVEGSSAQTGWREVEWLKDL